MDVKQNICNACVSIKDFFRFAKFHDPNLEQILLAICIDLEQKNRDFNLANWVC